MFIYEYWKIFLNIKKIQFIVCVFQSHNFHKETIVKQSRNLIKSRKQWYVMCFWAKKALPLFDGKYELWNKICKWLSDLTDWVCAQQVVKFQVWSLHEGQSTLASPDLGFKAKLSLNWNTGLASKCLLVIFKQSFIQGFFNYE